MKNKLIVANWKMNGDYSQLESWVNSFLDSSVKKLDVFENVVAVICPPSIFADEVSANVVDYAFDRADAELTKDGKEAIDIEESEVAEIIDKYRVLKVGAQDCHGEENGAYTGDVSAKMVAEVGCEYVIVGHSERRKYHYETNEIVSSKVKAVNGENMTAILCVGEDQGVRDSGKHVDFVTKQLRACVDQDLDLDYLVVAYEPIWAIGTGIVPTIEQIQEMTNVVKKICEEDFAKNVKSFSVLYGGSVGVKNAESILAVENLDGLLIGKASLNVADFFQICQKAI